MHLVKSGYISGPIAVQAGHGFVRRQIQVIVRHRSHFRRWPVLRIRAA